MKRKGDHDRLVREREGIRDRPERDRKERLERDRETH